MEQEILNTSATAVKRADDHARRAIKHWEKLIWQRIESRFIPWYSDYWTQQWLVMKMAWYQMQEADGEKSAAGRMRVHLLEQLQQRVLDPVAEETSPAQIAVSAASFYLESMRAGMASIQDRHRIPDQAWRAGLEQIELVQLKSNQKLTASLYQLLQAGDPERIPAYAALMAQSRSITEELRSGQPGSELDRIVNRAVSSLKDQAALKGGAAAASAIAGGGIGLLISAGVTAWGISEHSSVKAALEAELRDALRWVLKGTMRRLTEERWNGLLSLVEQMHSLLEEQLWTPLPGPVYLPLPSPSVEKYPTLDLPF